MKLTENILNPAGKTLKAYIPPTVEFDDLEEEQFMAGSPMDEEGPNSGEGQGDNENEFGHHSKAASFIFEDDADMEMPADIDF